MIAQRILLGVLCAVACGADEFRDAAVKRAEDSVAAAVEKASKDPSRPAYHFRPPALWMNDPNGTIFHNGYYHLFYQHNPYGDTWGHMHWGHARSKDLVHWEHLPIALWPSEDRGEGHVFSGCAAINGDGVPMLFYTSVSTAEKKRPNEQWAAIGDADMIKWEKHPNNPILSQAMLPFEIGPDWRDPFIFHANGRTFLVCGADTKDEAIIPIFEADTPQLDKWTYKGILYRQPKSAIQFFECPNFFPLDGKWVLIFSPYKPLRYMVGTFDIEKYAFTPEKEATLDYGSFYASNIYQGGGATDKASGAQGSNGSAPLSIPGVRPSVLVGWVRGFKEGLGWNGCMSIPRTLSIGEDGFLRQIPYEMPTDTNASAPPNNRIQSGGEASSFETTLSSTAEGTLRVALASGGSAQVTLTPKSPGVKPVRMEIATGGVAVDEIQGSWNGPQPDAIEIICQIDRSVLELAVTPWPKPRNGTLNFTKVIEYSPDGYNVLVQGKDGAKAMGGRFRNVSALWLE